MTLFKKTVPFVHEESLKEINERLQRRYLDRLSLRVKKLRKLLAERNWEELRTECTHLAQSGENFGFANLTVLAEEARNAIPRGKIAKAAMPTQAKKSTENLISAVDAILFDKP